MIKPTIRYAEEKDLSDITNIFNQAIAHQPSTGFLNPFSVEQRKPWFKTHKKTSYPILVAEFNDKIIGWISVSPYRNGRAAFHKTIEVSFFIDKKFQKKGIGTILLQEMMQLAKALGYQMMLAIVLDKNMGSIILLEDNDFERCGFLPDVAIINGQKYGHLYYAKQL